MSELLNASKSLIALTADQTTTQTGTTMSCVPSGPSDEGNFVALFDVTQVGTGSVNAVVQSSWDDGTTWHDIATMTALAAAGNKNEIKDISNIGPKVRAKITPGSSATIASGSQVRLAWSGAFAVR